jgi:L-fuculose-phosphate aldolase
MEFKSERKEVAKFMRRLYKQRLTTSSGGNISIKNSDGFIFITASQTDKSIIKYEQIIVFNSDGENLTTELKPSMEFNMHLQIYKARPDIYAIVHAHPVYASTFAVTDKKLDSSLTGEARFVLGKIEIINYELMGTLALAEACTESLKKSNVAIMNNHGAICLGQSLFQAFDRMEVLEFTSNIYFNTLLLNDCKRLNDSELKEIDEI